MEQTLKRKIVDAAEAIKKKVAKMRDIEIENASALEKVFKPVTGSLNHLIEMKRNSIQLDKTFKNETVVNSDKEEPEDEFETEEEVEAEDEEESEKDDKDNDD
ncbi:hypothetical protein O0L34_g18678 [Tuta absoluta]|nr:hypothetical protein O0L34_g18678 [Tuta absoluta]